MDGMVRICRVPHEVNGQYQEETAELESIGGASGDHRPVTGSHVASHAEDG